jgi:hypothetical protein
MRRLSKCGVRIKFRGESLPQFVTKHSGTAENQNLWNRQFSRSSFHKVEGSFINSSDSDRKEGINNDRHKKAQKTQRPANYLSFLRFFVWLYSKALKGKKALLLERSRI